MSLLKTRMKPYALCALVLALTVAFVGCADQQASSTSPAASSEVAASDQTNVSSDELRIVSMKGPTSVGLASMMQKEQGQFTVVASADEVTPILLQDKADIACVPANVAALLYQKTEGALRVIDVNTLGVLYVVTGDTSVDSLDKLVGRSVYMTGKGTVPEYTLRALLSAGGLSLDEVDVQFKSEPAEVAALINADDQAIGILPQPYATAVCAKNPALNMRVDLTAEWNRLMGADAGLFVTGVTVAKASTISENPEAVNSFLERHAASAGVSVSDPASVTQTIVDLGIIESAPLAEKSLPLCNAVCLTGGEMKDALSGYLATLYAQDPASVGGALPDDDFYYLEQ